MIAKLIVRGRDRAETLARLARAIDEYRIVGVPTTLPLLRALVDFAPVIDASYGTASLEPFASSLGAAASGGTTGEAGLDTTAAADTIRVEVNDKLFRVRFIDLPAAMRPAATSGAKAAPKKGGNRAANLPQGNDIVAPMHGVIVEIPVTAGQAVAQGDVVAVIEAMKMMNEIRAHKAGTIAAVHAAKGATVEAHTKLASFAE